MKARPAILLSIVLFVCFTSCSEDEDPLEMTGTWTVVGKTMELFVEGQDAQDYYFSHINFSGKTPPELTALILGNFDDNFAIGASITFNIDGTFNTSMNFKGPKTWSAIQSQMILNEGTADEIIVEILNLTLHESQLEFEISEIADYNADLEDETLTVKFNMNLRR